MISGELRERFEQVMAGYGKEKGGRKGRRWVGDVSGRGMKHEFEYLPSVCKRSEIVVSLVF
jgi:hypothetical protein